MTNATPARLIKHYWEDFGAGTVREFGQMPVSREAVLEFAPPCDPQPFHLDDEAAAGSLFGRLSASGWHTCSVGMRFAVDSYINACVSLGSPGLDNIRWHKPVRPGDTITYRRTTLASRASQSRPGVGLMQGRIEAFNQHGELVMSNEGWGLFGRRPQAWPPGARGG